MGKLLRPFFGNQDIYMICKALHNDMKPALSGIPQILENINI